MKVFFFIISLLMLLLTGLRLWPSTGNFIFAGGSDMLMSIVASNFFISITFAVIFFITVFFYKKKKRPLVTSLLTVIFLLWFLSGRMIALFPDGRLLSGWFYIQTNRTDICRTDIDCEKVFYYDTKFEKLSFWKLRIVNKEANATIFTGPFVWRNTIKLFVKEFPSSYR